MKSHQRTTVLITEDDDGHAFLIEESLRDAGLNADFRRFSDGEEVLAYLFRGTAGDCLEENHPYLLLLDVRMPKVDGIEVLRQIKRNSGLHKLPVIMLTTSDDSRDVDLCHSLHCNGYIQKPVSWESFSATLDQLGHFLSLLELPHMASVADQRR